jgi:hypothetical protein
MRPSTAVIALVSLSALVAAEEPWKTVSVKDGITVEKRAVPGSKFYEHRASFVWPLPPERMAEAIWIGIERDLPPTVKQRQVLRRSADEVLVYDQIRTPVVSDRDVTIRIRRVRTPDGWKVRFESANELGPPPDPKYVRLPMVRGSWTVTATPSGSHVVYDCYSEPGGSVPAWLVRGPQEDQVLVDVKRILRLAAK